MSGASVIVGGDVRSMDAAGTRAEAIAWRGERIVAVGRRADVLAAAGAGAEVTDAGGAAVVPGFVDAHHHVSLSALYGGLVRLAPPAVTDIASLQAALAEAARRLEPGRWLVATEWDELLLAERRAPTRAELDDAVPGRPIFALHYSCHRAVASSRALALAGIGPGTPDPAGGVISRDRRGRPDGLLVERAMSPVEALARSDLVARDEAGFLARMAAHYRALVAAGITGVVDTTVPADLVPLYRECARRGDVLVPTLLCPVSSVGYLEEPWDALDGPVTGEEEGPLAFGPIKLVLDGAPTCSMCLSAGQVVGATLGALAMSVRLRSLDPVRTSLSLKPRFSGMKVRSGVVIYRTEEAARVMRAAVERGFALATHAVGNEAVGVALDAYTAAGPLLHRARTARIEHAAFLDRGLVGRIAGSGAAVVVQPHFLMKPAFGAAPRIPGLRTFPLRWLLDAGVEVAGSSDYPVAGFDPLDGIRSAVLRRTDRGLLYEPDQRIELDEAIALYTRAAASVSGWSARAGTLEPGKRADLVVLDGPLTTRADLEQARVRATFVAGRLLHGSVT